MKTFLSLILFTLTASLSFAQDGIPILQASVVAFDQATCPTGWSQVNETRGRVLIGQGSGNLDSAGNSLTTRTMASVGGLEYTNGIPAANVPPTTNIPAPDKVLARGVDPGGPTEVDLYNSAGTDTEIGRIPSDSNLPPFKTVIFCQKD